MLLIGSRALMWHCNNYFQYYFTDRNVIDWDIICTKDNFKTLVRSVIAQGNRMIGLSFEEGTNKGHAKFINSSGKLEVIESSFIDVTGDLQESDAEIYQLDHYIGNVDIMGFKTSIFIANLPVLALMKHCHKYKKNSVHFQKTRNDIQFLNSLGFGIEKIIRVGYAEILKRRENLTYNYGHPKLNTSKKEFFTDSVPYVYDHDTIHEAVKHLDHPAYMYYIEDGEQVKCSKEKFFAASPEVRLYGVLEEAYVLALERAIIPYKTDPYRAFEIALEKVCTSITSGWFREYAYDNYYTVKSLYNSDFVNKFQEALESGKIKPFNNSTVY